MNAPRTTRSPSPISARPTTAQTPVRHVHRERDFGIGYGNSSGYANPERRYVAAGMAPSYFRCR